MLRVVRNGFTGKARAVLQLVRPYSTLLTFLAVSFPIFARSRDLDLSLQRAVPLALASMCTFLTNDLDDLEKDKINHPERPLPSGRVSPAFVTALYFTCLVAGLLTTYSWVTTSHVAFLYYVGFALGISYRYIVAYAPSLKAPYVAAASTLPVCILAAYYPAESALYTVATALFLFILGRELCKDLLDRAGDPVCSIHRFSETRVAALAFVSECVGVAVISRQIESVTGALVVVSMATLVGIAFRSWFWSRRKTLATALMKAAVFVGLYFLL